MRAGILKYPIEIYAVTVTLNEYNEQKDTYSKSYDTRANVTYNSGNRTDVNNEIIYPLNLTFEVRDYVPVGVYDEVKYKGKFYRIIAIQSEDENLHHAMMKRLICEEVNE